MKTKTFLFFLPCFLFGIWFESDSAVFHISADPGVSVEISFGRRAPCIAGSGICSMQAVSDKSQAQSDATGEIRIDQSGRVVLKIDKNSISVAKSQEQFVDQTFTISESFQISSELLDLLGYGSNPKSLEAGVYNIQELDTTYSITF